MNNTEVPEIRLIVSDLDGTLFGKFRWIAPENIDAIHEALDRGIRFMICTGRPIQDIYHSIYDHDLDQVGIIGMNGSCCIDGIEGNLLWNQSFSEEQWRSYAAVVRKYPEVSLVISGTAGRNGKLWLDYPGEDVIRRQKLDRPAFQPPDDGAVWQNAVNKLFCYAPDHPEALVPLRDELRAMSPDIEVHSSWWDNIEIIPTGCNKGKAIHRIAGEMGVSTDNIMALGDNINDIPMLRAAGIGVCMSNGTDDAKAVCRAVVENGDACGVSRAIRRFALR